MKQKRALLMQNADTDQSRPGFGTCRTIIDLLEYILVLFIIIQCNSFYTESTLNGSTDMNNLLYTGMICLLIITLLLHAVLAKSNFIKLVLKSKVLIPLAICSVIFFFINVSTQDIRARIDYIRNFVILLPLLILLFKVHEQEGKPFDLFRKHSTIVCIFALLNLIVYITAIFNKDTIMADRFYTRWYGTGNLTEVSNIGNIVSLSANDTWQILGIPLPRNHGIFPEPLMYVIPLLTALFTELFINTKGGTNSSIKRVLLTITLFTAQATLGLILSGLAWSIKIVQFVRNRKKDRKYTIYAVILLCVVFLASCFFVVTQKNNANYAVAGKNISSSSIRTHVDDYRICLEAFLSKPLFGCGYNNTGYVRQFMPEERLRNNSGFSNSIMLVFAEGGLFLGIMCLLPLLILMSGIRKKDKRSIALWGLCPFLLFIVTIFHFRAFMIAFFAFGYSFVEFGDDKRILSSSTENKGISYSISDLSEFSIEDSGSEKKQTLRNIFGYLCPLIILIIFGEPIWSFINRGLRRYQWSLSLSAVKGFCLQIGILIGLFIFHLVIRDKKTKRGGRFLKILMLVFSNAIYIWLYPHIYSVVRTSMEIGNVWAEWSESLILLCIWIIIILFFQVTASFFLSGVSAKKWSICFGCLIVLAITAEYCINRQYTNAADMIKDQMQELQTVTENANGLVYSNELPALYHSQNSKIDYCSSFGEGFSEEKDLTIICEDGSDYKLLFNAGYKMTALENGRLLYSNDESLIDKLSFQGYKWYNYFYPSVQKDLYELAHKNALEMTETGSIILSSDERSLKSGTYDLLDVGQYTVTFDLHIDRQSYQNFSNSTTLGILKIKSNYGKKEIKSVALKSDSFDENGNAQINISFSINDFAEGIEYLVLLKEKGTLLINRICYQETPKYITATKYDCFLRPIRENYFTKDGLPYIRSGYSSVERIYDLKGRKTKECYFGIDGKRTLLSDQYSMVFYQYDDKNRWVFRQYYDTDDNPTLCKAGYHSTKRKFDQYGNVILEAYYDVDGKPKSNSEGYAEFHHEFDNNNRVIKDTYYDEEGKPTALATHQAAVEYEYDAVGNCILYRYLDTKGKPVLLKSGWAELHRVYNVKNLIVEESYYDTDGKLIIIPSGYAIAEYAYDEANNRNYVRYMDSERKPIHNTSGYAEIRKVFNSDNRVVYESYFDTDGQPVTLRKNQAAVEYNYDAAGNCVLYRYLGKDGKTVLLTDGWAELRREYNSKRQITEESYYGTDGKLLLCPAGYAIAEYAYDEANNRRFERYLDTECRPIMNASGYAEIHRLFNSDKRVIKETYFDEAGMPIALNKNQAGVEYDYDAMGNMILIRYLDTEGDAIMTPDGFAELRRVFNSDKQVILEEYYDQNDEYCIQAAGYAAIEQIFDGKDLYSRLYLSTAGEKMLRTDGYAEARWNREEDSAVRNLTLLDLDGNEVSMEHLNLAKDIRFDDSGWSEWMIPTTNVKNSCFNIGTVNLGKRTEGDAYTCQIEIEFSGVTQTVGMNFGFQTQGAADGVWTIGNIWDSNLVFLSEVPKDGIYSYMVTRTLNEGMVNVNTFNIGFRCDNWASGKFRVRFVKIEKGEEATEWTPGI